MKMSIIYVSLHSQTCPNLGGGDVPTAMRMAGVNIRPKGKSPVSSSQVRKSRKMGVEQVKPLIKAGKRQVEPPTHAEYIDRAHPSGEALRQEHRSAALVNRRLY